MSPFNQAAKNYFPKLKFLTLAITRAHGQNHSEVFEVRELFKTMDKKTRKAKKTKPNLDTELVRLRDITNHYTIPSDACEAYTAVYTMLSEVDEAYQVN